MDVCYDMNVPLGTMPQKLPSDQAPGCCIANEMRSPSVDLAGPFSIMAKARQTTSEVCARVGCSLNVPVPEHASYM